MESKKKIERYFSVINRRYRVAVKRNGQIEDLFKRMKEFSGDGEIKLRRYERYKYGMVKAIDREDQTLICNGEGVL